MSTDKKIISPNMVHGLAKAMIEKINKSDFIPHALVGLNRGGIIPLGYLSYGLNIRDTFIFDINLYNDEKKIDHDVKSIKEFIKYNLQNSDFKEDRFEKILIVDDLIDSGETMELFIECFKEIFPNKEVKTAVLYQNTSVNFKATFNGFEEEKKDWLIFPWDLI